MTPLGIILLLLAYIGFVVVVAMLSAAVEMWREDADFRLTIARHERKARK